MITQEKLREVLDYFPLTGKFVWKVSAGTKKAGSEAGSLHHSGYVQIKVCRVLYEAHRLAWLYMTGSWPINLIDHKDLNRSSNVWLNLREATRSQNAVNCGAYKSNKCGFKGVHLHRETGKWEAGARLKGKKVYLGLHASAELASKAYQNFTKQHHGEFQFSPKGVINAI